MTRVTRSPFGFSYNPKKTSFSHGKLRARRLAAAFKLYVLIIGQFSGQLHALFMCQTANLDSLEGRESFFRGLSGVSVSLEEPWILPRPSNGSKQPESSSHSALIQLGSAPNEPPSSWRRASRGSSEVSWPRR